MAEVNHFAFGATSPILAVLTSALGCLLGIILATKAQQVSGLARVRLLTYATIAVGVTGVWQANILAMLGFAIPASVLRYDPLLLAASLVAAAVTMGGGVFLLGYGRVGFWRLLGAGTLFGLGVAGTHALILASVRVGGTITYDQRVRLISAGAAIIATVMLMRFTVALRGLSSALVTALAAGGGISLMHYVAIYSIRIDLHGGGQPDEGIVGLSPMLVAAPTLLFGSSLIAMLWFFTVGAATARDLNAVFDGPGAEQIEPWMIEEVTSRIAYGTQPPAPAAIEPRTARRPPGPRPTPGIFPVWRSMPVWGAIETPNQLRTERRRRGEVARASNPDRVTPPVSGSGSARLDDGHTSEPAVPIFAAAPSALPRRHPPSVTNEPRTVAAAATAAASTATASTATAEPPTADPVGPANRARWHNRRET